MNTEILDTSEPRRVIRLVSRRWLSAVGVAIALAMPTGEAGAQDADLLLAVDATGELRGLTIEDIQRGEVRVRWDSDEPRLFVDSLRLDPARLPAAVEGSFIPTSIDTQAESSACLVVSTFDFSTRNRLGANAFTFEREPSSATIEAAVPSGGHRVLRYEYLQARSGFAGLALPLRDTQPLEGTLYYLDGRPYEAITFRLRGSVGGEDVLVRMADADAARRETAVDLGTLADFVDAPEVTTDWQTATIRLDRLPPRLDRARLDKLLLLPATTGGGTIEIDDVQLCRAGARPTALQPAHGTSGERHAELRALWVWNTSTLLGDPAAASALLAFLPAQDIDTVYLQLPGSFIGPDSFDPEEDGAALRGLLGRLHEQGVGALAMDGAPEYALPEQHEVVTRTVRRVARYNEAAEPSERFVGVHYDIEPYLLDEYSGTGRWPVLRGYLDLLSQVHALSRSAGLTFEVAIPFWFDAVVLPPDPRATPATESVVLTPLSDLVVDRVDSVALMDYRTGATGPNGTVALGEGELLYASEQGRRVVLGLETTWLPDREVFRFYGQGIPGWPERAGDKTWVVAVQRAGRGTLNLMQGDGLERLRARHAHAGDGDDVAADQVVLHWEATVRIPVSARGLTFYDLGVEALRQVIEATVSSARRYPAFGGVAVHHFGSYLRLVEEARASNRSRMP